MGRILAAVILLCLTRCHAHTVGVEPKCSKFDFEEKVLEKVIKVDHKMETVISDMNEKYSQLQEEMVKLKTELERKRTSSMYVQWGRTQCSGNGSELIYRGYIAGSHYNQAGGANYICLPENPTWGNYDDSANSHRSFIYGTEIDIQPEAVSISMFGRQVNENDLPCAVCQTRFSVTHMFPGRATCFPGWALQYTGYLVSEQYPHSFNKKYECLDQAPEAVPRGNNNDDQSILYLVEAKCGSLPCPPYVEGREIACAVCSK